jgi:hypothetical protein
MLHDKFVTIHKKCADVAVCVKKREDELRRKTRKLRTRDAKGIEVDGGICEHLL